MDAANKDLQDALALAPTNVNSLLNYANLQWKLGQKDAARDTFTKVLGLDPNNRTALSSLGYLARDKGGAKTCGRRISRAPPPRIRKTSCAVSCARRFVHERKEIFPRRRRITRMLARRAQNNALTPAGRRGKEPGPRLNRIIPRFD